MSGAERIMLALRTAQIEAQQVNTCAKAAAKAWRLVNRRARCAKDRVENLEYFRAHKRAWRRKRKYAAKPAR